MLAAGQKSFYKRENGTLFYFDFESNDYKPVPVSKDTIFLSLEKEKEGRVLKKNTGASFIDIGDGVGLVEFHSKMNSIGEDIGSMLNYAGNEVEKNYDALVISNQGANFSVGANLMMVLMLAQDQDWDEIDFLVRNFQNVNMLLKHAEKPVVVAPFGLTLGGGCEITLHASKVQAAAETYIGQVEVGVGVIPAGGGTKEMTLRSLKRIEGIKEADPLPFIQRTFETLGMAKVATSALEAKKFGFLRETDLISMNSEHLIGDAKKTALAMAMQGYKKPIRQEKIMALGESVLSPILIALDQMHEAGYITDYDKVIGEKLAYIITGGNITQPKVMDEQYFLDLEREAFLSLCGDKRTQDRMAHMLKKGKPLRN